MRVPGVGTVNGCRYEWDPDVQTGRILRRHRCARPSEHRGPHRCQCGEWAPGPDPFTLALQQILPTTDEESP